MKKIFGVLLIMLFCFTNVCEINAATIASTDLKVDNKTCYKNFHNDLTNEDRYWDVASEFITVDSKTAYCVDFGIYLKTGAADFQQSYLTKLNNNKELYNKISLIGLYGYDYESHKTNNYYAAAQLLIWQEVTNAGLYPKYKVSGMNFYSANTGYHAGELINLDKEKSEILKLVDDYYKKPSFCNQKYTIKKGESITITDKNSVLANYTSMENEKDDYVNYEVDGNEILLEGLEVGTGATFTFTKGNDETETFVYGVSDGQKVIVPTDYPEVSCKFTVEVTEEDAGYIQIKKVDKETNEPLEGVEFSIYNSDDEIVDTVVTNNNGIALSRKLPYGKYYILEVESLDGYILSEEKIEVEIDANDTFEIEFTNEKEVPEQVPTSDILIGVVWAIGLFCLGLGIHYYTEFRKKES